MNDLPLLSLLIWVPIIGALLMLLLGDKNPGLSKAIALILSLVTLLLCVPLYIGFQTGTAEMQFVEFAQWVPHLNINYSLGVDGFSMPLIILTSFSMLLVVLAGWDVIDHRPGQYMAAFLIMEGLMNGVFASMDSILFYVFWEGMLIPMFLIIGIWGGPNRVYATLKFFLYTFLGSVFMLVALIYMGVIGDSFAIADMHKLTLPMQTQSLIFFAFLIAFAVKVPMFPVHTWLPDAHVEAPTGGSVILAAIMLKMGTYGFIRFSMPITPDAASEYAFLMIVLSLIAVVYIGLVALVQEDMKKLIAYSSIAHMGFVTLGFFIAFSLMDKGHQTAAELGMQGGLIQMISHGFISAALFLCVGVLYDRIHSRNISDYGGVANTMPKFAAFFMLFAMANSGLPGTSGFVGEFMVILAAFQESFWYAALAGATLILGAAYSLWMYKRVVFGDVGNDKVADLQDINARETVIFVFLAIMVLALGLYPAPLVEIMDASVTELLRCGIQSKLPGAVVSGVCS
jgi:NADH-quinone oxidoreductase subunit M